MLIGMHHASWGSLTLDPDYALLWSTSIRDTASSLVQVSQAKTAISKEQKLKEQLREQMASAANDSKRQVTVYNDGWAAAYGNYVSRKLGPACFISTA